MAIFGNFYNAHSPDMALSRDSRSKFRKNLFFLILHLILGKVRKFLMEKLSTSEVIGQKPHWGGGGWKHPPNAFRVNKGQSHDVIDKPHLFHDIRFFLIRVSFYEKHTCCVLISNQ